MREILALPPNLILHPTHPDFSIVDRFDELRQMGVVYAPRTVDESVMQMLDAIQNGFRLETPNRRFVMGVEYMERMRVPKTGNFAFGDFVIVGNDPHFIAAWNYVLPVTHPKVIETLYG
ncbi:hypothetical protein HYV80_00605 [Candidatus Woesearchaeota archaeon]|nr:hypothetical protein [Candidatus Woesearchaeota archaeon]